jgi:hypothetical protein
LVPPPQTPLASHFVPVVHESWSSQLAPVRTVGALQIPDDVLQVPAV